MKAIIPCICLLTGLAAGSIAGHYQGVAVTLEKQFAYQSGLMAGLAEETDKRHR